MASETRFRLAATRDVLLTIIENLAADEASESNAHRRIPSTRELARMIAGAGVSASVRASAREMLKRNCS